MAITPIPEEAMPVVEILRRDVEKPDADKIKDYGKDRYRRCLRWSDDTCPMGRHPLSTCFTPVVGYQFAGGACSDRQVFKFYQWWDHQAYQDRVEAVEAIWPNVRSET